VSWGEQAPEAEVVRALARIEGLNPQVNAVIETFPERAVAAALSAPPGRLQGMPVVIKDTFALPWRSPREGMGQSPGIVGKGASALYRRLTEAGAAVVGVGNMHQLGIGSTGTVSHDGPCRNPWDLDRVPGGSSSGPAAAVASGMVPAAIGTDGAGSIRIPAAYCGLVGLKPTFGAVPREGYSGVYSTMAVIGPLTRDTPRCRRVAEALVGRPLAAPGGEVRIGIVGGELWDDVEPGVASLCRDALDALGSAGTGVSTVRVDHMEHALIASVTRMTIDRLPLIGPDWIERMGDDLDPTIRGILMSRQLVTGNLTSRIDRVRAALRREMRRVFGEIDLLAWPTVPGVAPRIERPVMDLPSGKMLADVASVRQGGLANLTGIPSVSVPVGLSEGLPASLMFHGAWGREDLLLDVAERLEQVTERQHVELRPPVVARD
jgi:Asp-tRNA(Asn)/Glu-tRNA(Gln) amidotransferase A subunit family amidase